VTYALYENISPVLRLHRHRGCAARPPRPLAIIGSGLLFGALEAGATAMQRDAEFRRSSCRSSKPE